MVNSQYYYITRKGKEGDIVYFDYSRLDDGFNVTPKNRFHYDGIQVNKLIIIKQTFIEKLLKKKIKKKVELYLQFIIDIIDNDSGNDDGTVLREALNDLSRYRDILRYKYNKYLGEEYVDIMIKKIELLEYELKLKVMAIAEKEISFSEPTLEDELTSRRGR
jgi:hypothetical protein